eukprot:5500912-Prymnesium_polylepis.1
MFEDEAPAFADGEGRPERCARPATLLPSTTVGEIVERHRIRRVAALKVDCEGCEWEILPQIARMPQFAGTRYRKGECHQYRRLQLTEAQRAQCAEFTQ